MLNSPDFPKNSPCPDHPRKQGPVHWISLSFFAVGLLASLFSVVGWLVSPSFGYFSVPIRLLVILVSVAAEGLFLATVAASCIGVLKNRDTASLGLLLLSVVAVVVWFLLMIRATEEGLATP
jgi:hypothetical protein